MCYFILLGLLMILIVVWKFQDSHPTVHESFDEQTFDDNDPWYNKYTGEQQRGLSIETPF